MNRTPSSRRQTRGFTLVELCTSVGICAALISQAVPAMTQLRHEQKLRAGAQALIGDLRYARSEATRLSEPVYFRVSGKGAHACYVAYIGTRDDCDCAGGQALCKTPKSQILKVEWLAKPLRLSSNAETLQFQYHQGLVTQTGSIDLSLSGGPTLRQVVAITGRVRSCSMGAQKIGGTPRCA